MPKETRKFSDRPKYLIDFVSRRRKKLKEMAVYRLAVLREVGKRLRRRLESVFLFVQIVIEKFMVVYCSFRRKPRNEHWVN